MAAIFYRNIRARDQLELFLLSAVSSLLLVRFYLHITGYPQIGTSSLHIAHMLWGGLLMMAAISLGISFLGARIGRLVALIGGIGFGIFIDELGKFITRDNNYFYQPAIGIIYAIFIVLYLLFNFLSRSQPLSSREYQLNALAQMEEAVVHDMNPTEKARVRELLGQADQNDPLTRQLQAMLASVKTIPVQQPRWLVRLKRGIERHYERFWKRKDSDTLLRSFFAAEAGLFVVSVVWSIYNSIDSVLDLFGDTVSYSTELAIGQLISSLVAACFVAWGTFVLPRSRMRAYEQFRRATLVNIFLTQCFAFARIEFDALPGFIFSLVLLGLISFAVSQERRLAATNG